MGRSVGVSRRTFPRPTFTARTEMHKFRIVMTAPSRGEIFMDGEQVKGVTAVQFRAAVDQISEVTLTLAASEVEIETEARGEIDTTGISSLSRTFASIPEGPR